MKISLERLLVESSKLQDHKQQSCMIRNMAIENVGSSGHRVKTNIDRSERSSPIQESIHPSMFIRSKVDTKCKQNHDQKGNV